VPFCVTLEVRKERLQRTAGGRKVAEGDVEDETLPWKAGQGDVERLTKKGWVIGLPPRPKRRV
jgi:hypothetical protein